ncbi:MAG: hypothetical protein Tsb0014_09650 [Pleurocapsa sp.]
MTIVLEAPQAQVNIEALSNQKRKISVQPSDSSLFVLRRDFETTYSLELITSILKHKGAGYLCDEIARDEDSSYLQEPLKYLILGHVAPSELKNKRLLDFGCGSGSSTVHLARMFPDTEIVGIELCEESLAIAKLRAKHYQLNNVRFLLSPNGEELPDGIGEFDFIVLNAVYEHLLPHERVQILPQLWSLLRSQGMIFFNETPHRYWLVETHTTNLPLINYLPDFLTLAITRRFSARIAADESWELLLRKGIRGGTEQEIIGIIENKCSQRPLLLEPHRLGMSDRIDLRYASLVSLSVKQKAIKAILKTVKSLTGYTFASTIAFAIQKEKSRSH